MQSDAFIDDFLQLQVIAILHVIVLSPTRNLLQNTTVLRIIGVCQSLLLAEGNTFNFLEMFVILSICFYIANRNNI